MQTTKRINANQLRTEIDCEDYRIVIYTLPYGTDQLVQTRVITLELERRADGASCTTTPAYLKIWCESVDVEPRGDSVRLLQTVRNQHNYMLTRVDQIREHVERTFAIRRAVFACQNVV